jgi:hypothetical protein
MYGGLIAYMSGVLILQAAVVYATVLDLNGRRPQFREALTTGLREFLPLLVIGIMYTLSSVST